MNKIGNNGNDCISSIRQQFCSLVAYPMLRYIAGNLPENGSSLLLAVMTLFAL